MQTILHLTSRRMNQTRRCLNLSLSRLMFLTLRHYRPCRRRLILHPSNLITSHYLTNIPQAPHVPRGTSLLIHVDNFYSPSTLPKTEAKGLFTKLRISYLIAIQGKTTCILFLHPVLLTSNILTLFVSISFTESSVITDELGT
jgi:hypothetical protein